ncbi:MAG: hypothetical protein PUF48_00955 [Oscillospiraceae bacterium]|nr:hypothetical protein [Oscillospiraceae bacterium]
MTEQEVTFLNAKPVWLSGKQQEINCTAIFKAVVDYHGGEALLRVTGYTNYKIFVNGKFVAFGPARAGHGFYRVDELQLSPYVKQGENVLAIEVCGYNVNSYAYPNQPSFLQAEVIFNGAVVAYTDIENSAFSAQRSPYKYIKTQRYSFQRPFLEAYHLDPTYNTYFTDTVTTDSQPLELCEDKYTIARNIPYYDFPISIPEKIKSGRFSVLPLDTPYQHDMWGVLPDAKMFDGFYEEELEVHPYKLAEFTKTTHLEEATDTAVLSENNFSIYRFVCEQTGFVGWKLTAHTDAVINITFDEILLDGDVSHKRMNCCNVLYFELKKGTYAFESAEVYSMKFCKVSVYSGEVTVNELFLRQHLNTSIDRASFVSSNEKLNRIYKAAEQTFKQNAVDIYMDCPCRERAGWLCDSFFTARVERDLTGNSIIERNFIQNFLFPESFRYIPEGMIPCCYPSDHGDGTNIPNWAFWFVLQLKEYLARTRDESTIAIAKERVYDLFRYVSKFENDDGLMEDMPGWIFIEWSRANDFVDGVSYPSNMLYSAALRTAGELYNDPQLICKADSIKQAILEQSYNGTFFEDNRIRKDGKLIATGNMSECCQYYAFFLKIATPETHAELFRKLVEEFGPNRDDSATYPTVFKANAFIGNFLRLEMLSMYRYSAKILDEIVEFFDYMALSTGTLWEFVDTTASCNHGFSSHVIHSLLRDVLGIKSVDDVEKTVTCQATGIDIGHVECTVPLGKGQLKVLVEGDKYQYSLPEGYTLISVV